MSITTIPSLLGHWAKTEIPHEVLNLILEHLPIPALLNLEGTQTAAKDLIAYRWTILNNTPFFYNIDFTLDGEECSCRHNYLLRSAICDLIQDIPKHRLTKTFKGLASLFPLYKAAISAVLIWMNNNTIPKTLDNHVLKKSGDFLLKALSEMACKNFQSIIENAIDNDFFSVPLVFFRFLDLENADPLWSKQALKASKKGNHLALDILIERKNLLKVLEEANDKNNPWATINSSILQPMPLLEQQILYRNTLAKYGTVPSSFYERMTEIDAELEGNDEEKIAETNAKYLNTMKAYADNLPRRLLLTIFKRNQKYPFLKETKIIFDGSLTLEGKVCNSGSGIGKLTDCDGIYEGEFLEVLPHGNGIKKYFNEDVYKGNWKHGKMQGYGKYIYAADGNVYEGDWIDGKKHGRGKLTIANRGVFEGHYIDGKLYGEVKATSTNGAVFEGHFVDNKKHGQAKKTFANGKVSKAQFVNGELDEKWTCPNENKRDDTFECQIV